MIGCCLTHATTTDSYNYSKSLLLFVIMSTCELHTAGRYVDRFYAESETIYQNLIFVL